MPSGPECKLIGPLFRVKPGGTGYTVTVAPQTLQSVPVPWARPRARATARAAPRLDSDSESVRVDLT